MTLSPLAGGLSPLGVSRARAGFVGAYDAIPDIAAAYSMRRLLSSYSGPLLRLRRSSDNAESDFGYTGAGDLDAAAVVTWLGGASGFVRTWYDQSGNGHDAGQATVGSQPLYVASGQSGKPVLRWDGANDVLNHAAAVTGTTARTLFFVLKSATTANTATYDLNGQGTGVGANYIVTPEVGLRVNGGNKIFSSSTGTSAFCLLALQSAGSSNVTDALARLNGSALGTASSASRAIDTGAAGGHDWSLCCGGGGVARGYGGDAYLLRRPLHRQPAGSRGSRQRLLGHLLGDNMPITLAEVEAVLNQHGVTPESFGVMMGSLGIRQMILAEETAQRLDDEAHQTASAEYEARRQQRQATIATLQAQLDQLLASQAGA